MSENHVSDGLLAALRRQGDLVEDLRAYARDLRGRLEIERLVQALHSDENEVLRAENERLRERVAELERGQGAGQRHEEDALRPRPR